MLLIGFFMVYLSIIFHLLLVVGRLILLIYESASIIIHIFELCFIYIFLESATAVTDDQLCIHDDAPGRLGSIFDQVDQGFNRPGTELNDGLANRGKYDIRLGED